MDISPLTSSKVRTPRTCAHILWELNMQAQIPYESEEKVHNLCTYPPGIEYASTNPMQARICAHIPRKLNMQAH